MSIKYTEEQKKLIAAARLGEIEMVRELIESGFNVDCELKYGSSALMIAASRGSEGVIRLLAAAGAKMNRRNRFGATALLEAVEKGHHEVVRALVELGSEINLPHNNGSTVLLAATLRRDIKMIRTLLELGADPTIANFDGWSPVRWAHTEANPALLEVFGLEVHPPPDEAQKEELPAEKSIETGPATPSGVSSAFWTVFMRAASVGDLPAIRRLVEDDGVEINGQSPNGTTALIAAAKNGRAETVFELIELGADLNLADQDGMTALAWAAKKGQAIIVEALKDKGAKSSTCDEHEEKSSSLGRETRQA